MIRPVHWLIAAVVAVALHVAVLGFANTEQDVQMERSAGAAGAVWGLPMEMVSDIVDPTMEPSRPAEAVDQTEVTEEETPEETEVVEPETPQETETVEQEPEVEPEITDPTELAEAVEATQPAPAEPVETVEAVTPEPVAETPEPDPVETDEPMQVASYQGGIAVAPDPVEEAQPAEATEVDPLEAVPEVTAVEPVTETEVAAVTPVTEALEVEAEDAVPMPRIRPADVPRIEAPPKPKVVKKPEPKKPAPKKAAPAPTRTTTTTRATTTRSLQASAPAGEQVGTGGTRQGASGQHLVSSYAGKVAAHLRRHKRYPREAAAKRQSGTATVSFSISSSGGVRSARLARSSGNRAFDQEVVAMVRRAAPFPPIPSAIGKSSMTFTVPVRFQPR